MEAWWASKLYMSVDGGSLRDSRKVLGQHNWVADGTRFHTGRDFIIINSIKLIIGANLELLVVRGKNVSVVLDAMFLKP